MDQFRTTHVEQMQALGSEPRYPSEMRGQAPPFGYDIWELSEQKQKNNAVLNRPKFYLDVTGHSDGHRHSIKTTTRMWYLSVEDMA